MSVSDADFFDLLQRRDSAAALAALAARPSLCFARDAYLGSTPLHFAAHRGLSDVAAALLEAGAEVDALEGVSGSTPLHWAAEGGHVAIVQHLVARGAALDARDEWHRLTPLGWATVVDWAPQYRDDRGGAVACLVAAGAGLDPFTAVALLRFEELRAMTRRDGRTVGQRLGFVAWEMTPLHVAAVSTPADAVRVLLELGADRTARTTTGLTPLALACQYNHRSTAALLEWPGAPPDVSVAVAAGDAEAVLAALRRGPAVEDDVLSRLLFVAAEQQNEDIVTALLAAGAHPDVLIRHLAGERQARLTPLHFAARRGGTIVVRALLKAGADPNPGRTDGVPTPLHFAAGEGHPDTVRVLMAAGADRSARDGAYHATPAGWAEFGGHADVAALLASE